MAVFGALLREFRRKAGWTQEELAERSGLSTHAISVLETGRRQPRLSSVALLAKALGVDEAEREQLLAAAQEQAGGSEPPPPGATDRPVPRLLPYAVAEFTGRAEEVGRLLELAAGGEQGASTVVISAIDGMAGVGKTALAVKVGHTLADRFPDGQIFLDLHGFTPGQTPLEPGTAVARLLRALGVEEARLPERTEERLDLWRTEAARRRLLLVLDNALDDEQVRPLIPGHPGSLVLITSRRRLPALAGAVSMSLDVLPHQDAQALFTQVVGAARVAGQEEVVAEIVELCGRLPLAVRIAAARLAHRSTWTPEHLLARLRDQHQRLAELADEDDVGVAAAFAVSYEALTPEQQRAFRLAGLHPGEDFCARAVGALTGIAAVRAEELLEDLLDHHLLIEHAPGRYTFHDLLRRHAQSVAEAAEAPAVREAAVDALLDHYRHTAVTAVTTLYPQDPRWLPDLSGSASPRVRAVEQEAGATAWLLAERANLIACARCPQAGRRPGYVSDLSCVLYNYFDHHGFYADGLVLHAEALAVAERRQDRSGQAKALICVAGAYWRLGPYQKVFDLGERALVLTRELGDRVSEARCLITLAITYQRLGQYQQAADLALEGLALAEQTGDRIGRAGTLTVLALTYDRLGRYELARSYHQQALEAARETGMRVVEARSLCNLGLAEFRAGRFEEAGEYLGQAVLLAREIGDPNVEAISLTNLGAVHERLGRYEQALEQHQASLDIFTALEDVVWQARITNLLCQVHTVLGRYQEAAERQAWALSVAREYGDGALEVEALLALGANALAAGDPEHALAHHREALTLGTDQADPLVQARAHDGLGDAHHALGQAAPAVEHWREAHAGFARLGAPEAAKPAAKLAEAGMPVAEAEAVGGRVG
ncbi:ATP-binding protein [Streptomyces tateyamensis]|uniref:ATP-binding protein n=1 Tax=Streptomyces tateyamensis TaxID=565073 RepID=UPI0015E8DBA9|nr:helix-turn-helix domain-containing protein [Streptomyces tateyamensis]